MVSDTKLPNVCVRIVGRLVSEGVLYGEEYPVGMIVE